MVKYVIRGIIMKEMTYCEKNCMASMGINNNSFNFMLQQPMICPFCNAYEDGTISQRSLFPRETNKYYGIISYVCTHCRKIYLVVYDIDVYQKKALPVEIYPTVSLSYSNDEISKLSPRFIDMYNQALKAESEGNIELSAMGFRASLEILVKDFAVVELHKERSTVVKKSLYDAIGEYLGNQELVSSGDVIRILGNDYAHYERKYPEQDFKMLKSYMEIFIHLVETKLMLAHPPVARQLENPLQPTSVPQGSNTP